MTSLVTIMIFPDDDLFLDMVSRSTGFPMVGKPFRTVSLVVSDCPITYKHGRRRKNQVSQKAKQSSVTYDVSICDSLFSISSLAT